MRCRRPLLACAVAAAGAAWLARADEATAPGASVMLPRNIAGTPLEPSTPPAGPAFAGAPWFQPLVDAAPEGSVLRPPRGRYAGPVLINKRLTIEGAGITIDGGGKGTVLTVEGGGVTLRGLTFTGSGESHASDDACLNVRGDEHRIEDNTFDDCLFGIDLKQANRNIVSGNRIRSKDLPLGLRGDAIRLWYSMDNRIEGNVVTKARDVVVWYSNGNLIKSNSGSHSRYSLHFMFADRNVVEGNRYHDNSVGIYVMYTEGVTITNNIVSRSLGPTGMGIGFKEASDSVVSGNTILYCALGISSDLSPYQPDSTIVIKHNRIAYNGVGLSIVGDKPGTVIEGNVFEGNIDQVTQSGGNSAMRSTWARNYWDDFTGFDRDRDDVGDTPYELYAFSDRLWMELPAARFFKNAPLLEALDFLERLAPFSTPDLLVRDEAPLFSRPALEAP